MNQAATDRRIQAVKDLNNISPNRGECLAGTLQTIMEFVAKRNFSGLAAWVCDNFAESCERDRITDALWEG